MKIALILAAILATTACASSPSPSALPQPAADRSLLPQLQHERVDYWVDRFSRGDKHAEIATALQRKRQYEAMILEKLRRKGMAADLIYLAMMESGFNPQAHSAATARGIWQLVPDTARRYGLRVDDEVDERLDAEKSTDAALSYLAYLFNRFGSWYLAAAAYNAGENRVAGIMTAATGGERGTDADFYRLWEQFPGETRDFVPAMIAAAKIGNDPSKYGF